MSLIFFLSINWGTVWVHKTSLTPPPFIAVLVARKTNEGSCICVLGVMYLCVRGHVFVLRVMYLCVRGHVFVC